MRTYIYVDGFNFYYGAVKGTPYKWFDFLELFKKLLQTHHEILKIKYFTALVNPTIADPQKSIRQQTYIRALQHQIPQFEVYYGNFLSRTKWAQPANAGNQGDRVKILSVEEKGSDVNLAVHLLNDAWLGLYDCAVLVSNDSDLAEALRLVRVHHGKMIGVITPHKNQQSRELLCHATFVKRIRQGLLRVSQLPDPIPGTSLYKPSFW
ncbi:MAG: NYN domain-containing protein [Pseudomonadota bacterium]